MTEPLEALSEADRGRLRRASQPLRPEPMKAVLTDERFSDPDWIFERKLDGVRCIAARAGRELRLLSRTGKHMNRSYPELAEALEREGADDFVVDGEIVAFEGPVTSFSRLQRRMQLRDPEAARGTGVAVYLYLFDVIHLAGHDTTAVPLRSRKALLRRALAFGGHVRYLSHRNRDGEALFEDAASAAWRG